MGELAEQAEEEWAEYQLHQMFERVTSRRPERTNRHMIMTREQADAYNRAVANGHPVAQPPQPTQSQVEYLTWMVLHDLVARLNLCPDRKAMSEMLAGTQKYFTDNHGFIEMSVAERKADIASLLNELVEEHLGLVFGPEAF